MSESIKPGKNNLAFIDGKNLYYGTAKLEEHPWKINLTRFRIYLEQKYHITKARSQYFDYLDNEGIKEKIGIKKKRSP